MKKEERYIVNYYELPEEWQEEARLNNENTYEDESYVLPLENQTPEKHTLLDLSECMRTPDAKWDGVITVSNCFAIGIKFVGNSCDTVMLDYISC